MTGTKNQLHVILQINQNGGIFPFLLIREIVTYFVESS